MAVRTPGLLGDRSAAAIEAAWVISGKYGSKRLRLLG
jgi:hypothetical protein